MTFGDRLRRLREGKYSQEELADLLHVNNNTISKWENGAQAPHSKRVSELARILGTTTEYLLGDTESPYPPASPIGVKKENNSLVYEKNGERLELPATPEGYAFLKELFAMSMRGNPPATA